jgi:RNA polymerase sigma factor (sigma-70 family)
MSIQTFINNYLKNAPPLSEEEESALFEQYRENDDLGARSRIIESHTALVVSIAHNFAKTHKKDEFQDLFQAGLIGLLRATDNYDLSRNVRFVSYAKQWVMREIQITVRKNLRMAYVPITTQREKVFSQIIKYHKTASSIDELIKTIKNESQVSDQIIKEMIQVTLMTDISLNKSISSTKHNILPEDNSELLDILPSLSPNPEEAYQIKEVEQVVKTALGTLKESEEKIIQGKYFEEKSNEEISNEIDRGIVSMLNLELKIRKKLKNRLKHIKSQSFDSSTSE